MLPRIDASDRKSPCLAMSTATAELKTPCGCLAESLAILVAQGQKSEMVPLAVDVGYRLAENLNLDHGL
jgi:hypothetical protein